MNQNPYSWNGYPNINHLSNNNQTNDRLIGGFAFPFLLGGVTGAALAPAFYNRPYYMPYPYYGYYPYYR